MQRQQRFKRPDFPKGELIMTVKTIYEAFNPTVVSRKEKLDEIFIIAVDIFKSECEQVNAASADEVVIKLQEGINPHIWDVVRKNLETFEAATLLTIHENVLMTLVRKQSQEGV